MGEVFVVQSGISYAAGQLLAVVAPRTVLVVDAPTDWSLAGPLWELALDDAPVDEILDVLIRRGIRTAPSFAIVRVEGEAVRALVRGSVPVCFERTGEPVRLDATGATTWLEGLISGAHRVLVGSVESSSTLPFLVSTGVVLVSGLALPCGPALSSEGSSELPDVEDIDPPGGSSYDAPPVSLPSNGGGPYAPAASAPRVVDLTRTAPKTPATAFAAAPAPAPASARAFAPAGVGELNGHVPAVFDRGPAVEPDYPDVDYPEDLPSQSVNEFPEDLPSMAEFPAAPAPAPVEELTPAPVPVPAPGAAPSPEPEVEPEPLALSEPLLETDQTDETDEADESAEEEVVSASAVEAPVVDSPAVVEEAPEEAEEIAPVAEAPVAEAPVAEAPVAEVPVAESPVAESPVAEVSAAEPVEVEEAEKPAIEMRRPVASPSSPFAPADDDEPASFFDSMVSKPAAEPLEKVSAAVDEDDLLIEGEEAPPGPSPVDLPNFAPSAVSLPVSPPSAPEKESGFAFPQQSRFGSAPAAWPPALESDPEPEREESVGFDSLLGESYKPSTAPDRSEVDRSESDRYEPLEAYQADEPSAEPAESTESVADDDSTEVESSADPLPGSLPLRVRGQSLRPEQRIPLDEQRRLGAPNGNRILGGEPVPPPMLPPVAPPLRSQEAQPVSASASGPLPKSQPPVAPSPSPSGGLLLPSFFRGARAARKSGASADSAQPQQQPVSYEGGNGNGNGNGNGVGSNRMPAWPASSSGSSAPSAWAPPVRRGFPSSNDGPPSMPGVLRQPPNGGSPSGFNGVNGSAHDPTQVVSGANGHAGSGLTDNEPPREPPRLLGVWCDAGHVTSPDHDQCRVCGLPVPPQAPILVARPPLGVLIFDNGDRVEVDRPVVLGRDPKPVSSPDPEKPVLHPVSSATGQVSRTHAEVRASGWDVVLTDLDAMNGTALTLPGAPPVAIEPGVPTVITPGARVDLGGETGFVFEIEG